jgi:hypothetical protein
VDSPSWASIRGWPRSRASPGRARPRRRAAPWVGTACRCSVSSGTATRRSPTSPYGRRRPGIRPARGGPAGQARIRRSSGRRICRGS